MNSMNKRLRELEEQLAASQAREQQLREALGYLLTCKHGEFCDHYREAEKKAKSALALPNDTSVLNQVKAGYEVQIQVLRGALKKARVALEIAHTKYGEVGGRETDWGMWEEAESNARAVLAIPQDTSALEAVVAKAGEVMRERCCADAALWNGMDEVVADLRALPGVTLEDLQK